MVKVVLVVRELGRSSPDYSLDFELPAVPTAGQYISIKRPDSKLWSEDLIVRHVWWHLFHPETGGISDGKKVGEAQDIYVECDVAEGPHSSKHWLNMIAGARQRMVEVPTFDVSRFSISEDEAAAISGKTDE